MDVEAGWEALKLLKYDEGRKVKKDDTKAIRLRSEQYLASDGDLQLRVISPAWANCLYSNF